VTLDAILSAIRLRNLSPGYFRNIALPSGDCFVFGNPAKESRAIPKSMLNAANFFMSTPFLRGRLRESTPADFRLRAGYAQANATRTVEWSVTIDPAKAEVRRSPEHHVGGLYFKLKLDPFAAGPAVTCFIAFLAACNESVEGRLLGEARNVRTGTYEVIGENDFSAVADSTEAYIEPFGNLAWSDIVPSKCKYVKSSNSVDLRVTVTITNDKAWWQR
jgi:hypothetical protein